MVGSLLSWCTKYFTRHTIDALDTHWMAQHYRSSGKIQDVMHKRYFYECHHVTNAQFYVEKKKLKETFISILGFLSHFGFFFHLWCFLSLVFYYFESNSVRPNKKNHLTYRGVIRLKLHDITIGMDIESIDFSLIDLT